MPSSFLFLLYRSDTLQKKPLLFRLLYFVSLSDLTTEDREYTRPKCVFGFTNILNEVCYQLRISFYWDRWKSGILKPPKTSPKLNFNSRKTKVIINIKELYKSEL